MAVAAASTRAAAQRREFRICIEASIACESEGLDHCCVHFNAVTHTKKDATNGFCSWREASDATYLLLMTGDSLPSPTAIYTPYYRFGRKQIPKSKYFGRHCPQ